MKFNPDIYHRRSIRLKNYDYSQDGAYFITICCRDKECLLGKIDNGKMQLNECGEIVGKCWEELSQRFPEIQLEQFIIMPNHIHAIIMINDFNVGVGLALPSDTIPMVISEMSEGRASPAPTNNGKYETIGDIVCVLKSISAIKINKYLNCSGVPVWQRNYYEHIIRNEEELNRVREYINNNPFKWNSDEDNPINAKY